jgi:hypothetical protein
MNKRIIFGRFCFIVVLQKNIFFFSECLHVDTLFINVIIPNFRMLFSGRCLIDDDDNNNNN